MPSLGRSLALFDLTGTGRKGMSGLCCDCWGGVRISKEEQGWNQEVRGGAKMRSRHQRWSSKGATAKEVELRGSLSQENVHKKSEFGQFQQTTD